MTTYDMVIKNGMVVDGTGARRRRADIGIRQGKIVRIGNLSSADAARVIDAAGLVVAPGIIDVHTHYDAQIYWDPYLSGSGWHGTTTVAIGNCGFGFAPVAPELRDRSMQSMTRVEAIPYATMKEAMKWDWITFPEFLDSVDRLPKALNVVSYVPLNPLLVWVLGYEAAKAGRKPTEAETAEMVRLLNEALDAGACGWSAQCIGQPGEQAQAAQAGQGDVDGGLMPSDVMWPETRAAFAKVLGERGDGLIMMAGSFAPSEWETIATESGAPVLLQAVIAASDAGPAYARPERRNELYRWFEDCQERGLRIFGQGLTNSAPLLFTMEYFDLWPEPWGELLGPTVPAARKLENLASSEARERLRAGMQVYKAPVHYYGVGPLEDSQLRKTFTQSYERFVGRTIGDIAAELATDPVDLFCDIVMSDKLKTEFTSIQFGVTIEAQRDVVDHRYIVPGQSDGGAHTKYLAGAGFGTEYISSFVRDHKFISLEEAHWRLSCFPASILGLKDRGVLQEGAAADIIVYDYNALAVGQTAFLHDLPANEYRVANRGVGYRYVIVNGAVTIESDRQTETYSGKLLRVGGRGLSAS